MLFYVNPTKLKTFVRNFMQVLHHSPATHVSIKENFVSMDIYDGDRKYLGKKQLYILEGRSY